MTGPCCRYRSLIERNPALKPRIYEILQHTELTEAQKIDHVSTLLQSQEARSTPF